MMAGMFYWFDILGAVAIAGFFLARRVTHRGAPFEGSLFLVAVGLGSLWEWGFYRMGPQFTSEPVYRMATEFPYPPLVRVVVHSLWDGGILMAGLGLVRRLLPRSQGDRGQFRELGLMVAFGQVQEFVVELLATSAGTWTYLPKPWNPVLFKFGHGELTLMPQLVWLLASMVFYGYWVYCRTRVST